MKANNINFKINDFQLFTDLKIINADQNSASNILKSMLIDVCIVYFGIHVSQVPDVLINSAVIEIKQKFNDLTLNEIKYSFQRIEHDRKITVILNDLIKPIKEFKTVKGSILNYTNEIIKIENKKISKEVQNKIDQQIAIDVYNESLKKDSWSGSIFQCVKIAELIKDKFSEEEKLNWWNEVLKINVVTDNADIYNLNLGKFVLESSKKLFDNQSFRALKSMCYKRILAEKIVNEGIKRNIIIYKIES